MYEYYDNKLKKKSINLAPGEFHVTGEDVVINTVLGSCVAVAVYDPVLKIGGLNHFMLAETSISFNQENVFNVERYGLYAMEAVLNELIKKGCRKTRLQAKIFGGSSVLESKGARMDIGANNIRFAEKYLKTENIPVINRDTGGERARRIYFFPRTFRILLRRVQPSSELKILMDSYKKTLEERKKGGQAILF